MNRVGSPFPNRGGVLEYEPMKTNFKKPRVYIWLGVLLAILGISFFVFGKKQHTEETVTVTRSSITEEVRITGTVKATQKVSLSFDCAGSIIALPYPVGTTVRAGTIIASLQNESEVASVEEQKAQVAIEETKLAKINQGTREEELKLKEAEARKAEVALQNSVSKTSATIADSYSAGEEALNRYADPLFQNDDTSAPRLSYSSGTQGAIDAERKRLDAGASVKRLQKFVAETAPTVSTLEGALKDIRVVQDMFITLGMTLSDNSTLDTTMLADYRSRVTSARSALTTAITSLQTQTSALRDTSAEFDRASRALELARAKATPETVQEAQQEILQARAKLRSVEASLEKTRIRAPFNGKIASKSAEIGETVASGKSIMDFLGTGGFVIEANVSEADVTKIIEGDKANVTLDAYGNGLPFTAHVASIEPTSTEIDGVSTYKTTFAVDDKSTNIRSGMTANVTIKRVLKENALTLPSRAITTENDVSSVLKVSSQGPAEKVTVTLGVRNGAGDVEILSGLSAGETVLIPSVK